MSNAPAASPGDVVQTAPPILVWLPAAVGFLRRNVLGVALAGAAGAVLAAGAAVVLPPRYAAEVVLLVDSRRSHPFRAQPLLADAQSESVFVDSQVQVIRSPGVLRVAVERLGMHQDPRLAAGGGPGRLHGLRVALGLAPDGTPDVPDGLADREAAARNLYRALRVRREGLTSVVRIHAVYDDPAFAARVANTLADIYIEQQLGANAEAVRRAGTWLQERLGELREAALRADRAVQEYKQAHGLVELADGSLMGEAEIAEASQLVANVRARVADAQARVDHAEELTAGALIAGAAALQSPVVARLRQQYLDAARREGELAPRHGGGHAVVLRLREEMAETARAIQLELGQMREANRVELEVALANLRSVELQLRDQVARVAERNLVRASLRTLQSTADAYRGLFEGLLQRYTQATQDQSYPISDARVLAEALPPTVPVGPRASLLVAGGLLAGLLLGLAAAATREALDGRIRTPAALARAVGVPAAWVVSSRAPLRAGAFHPAAMLGAVSGSDTPMAEAVQRFAAAAIRSAAGGAPWRTVGFVGIGPDPGASAVADAIAAAGASAGKRVTLLRPGGSRRDASDGARALGIGRPGPGPAVTPDDAGPQQGADPLRWRARVGGAAGTHDLVIVDLEGLSPTGAMSLAAGVVDAVVMVACWGHARAVDASEAAALAAECGLPIAGAVLTGCDPKRMRLYSVAGAGWSAAPGLARRYA